MNLHEHVILGGGAALCAAPTLGAEGAVTFWAASVLIDVDHHWDYVSRNGGRDWSARGMFAYHEALFAQIRRREFVGLSVFHTLECFVLVGACAALWHSGLFLAALWGMVFHLCLDLVRLGGQGALFSRALSVVEYWIRRRRLIRQGIDPDEPYAQALACVPALAAAAPERGRRRRPRAAPGLSLPGTGLAPVAVPSGEPDASAEDRPRPISRLA